MPLLAAYRSSLSTAHQRRAEWTDASAITIESESLPALETEGHAADAIPTTDGVMYEAVQTNHIQSLQADDPHQISVTVNPWRLDAGQALEDLRRVLRIDARPPALSPLPREVVPVVVHEPMVCEAVRRRSIDASILLRDAQTLFHSISTPANFSCQLGIWHDRLALLNVQYLDELLERVDATLQLYQHVSSSSTPLTTPSPMQLREVRLWVDFLKLEVTPTAATVMDFADRLRSLAPLISLASERLTKLSTLRDERRVRGASSDVTPTDHSDIRAKVVDIRQKLLALESAIGKSTTTLEQSVTALQTRYKDIQASRSRLIRK